MARQSSTRTGLKKYNQVVPSPSHPNVLSGARAQLTSSAATEAGIGSGSLQGNVVAEFGSDGYNMNVGKPIVFDCSADMATLQDTGWVHMEMTPDYNAGLSKTDTASYSRPSGMTSGLISVYSTTSTVTSGSGSSVVAGSYQSYFGWSTASGWFQSYLNGTAGTDYQGGKIYIFGHDKQGAGENYIDVMWTADEFIDIYWSGLLVSRQVCKSTSGTYSPLITNIRKLIAFGANTSNSTTDLGVARIKNVFVAKANNAPVMDTAGAIGMIGDSQTVYGGMPTEMFDLPVDASGTTSAAGGIRCPWIPKNGLTATGTNPASNGFFDNTYATSGGPSYYGDSGYMCAFFRKLGKAGWMPSDNNKCYAVAGSAMTDAVAQLDYMMTAYGSITPDILCTQFGTNDYVAGISEATYLANAKAMLDAAYNYGIKKVILWRPPLSPLYSDASYQTKLAAILSATDQLPAYVISQGYGSGFLSIWDAFTYFGGNSPDSGSFRTDGVHLNAQGLTDWGKAYGDIAARWYSSGGSGSGGGVLTGILGSILG